MSATLYALVVLQGSTLTFSPGYTSLAECTQQYRGPFVGCFDYDPEGTSWTAFFRLADGSLRVVRKIPSEPECQRYIGAFRSDVPTACRQLAMPNTCSVACTKPLSEPSPPPAPPPPAAKPEELKPDPATTQPPTNDIQVDGRQYKRVAGLTWVEKESSFADVSVGPSKLEAKDFPTPLPPKQGRRTALRQQRYAQQQFDPFGALVSLVTTPFARRDW